MTGILARSRGTSFTRAQTATVRGLLVSLGVYLWMIKPVGDIRLVILAYALVLAGAALSGLQSGFWIEKRIGILGVLSLIAGVVGVMIGIWHANPGAPSETVFFVIAPLIWLVIIAGIDTRSLRAIINMMPLAGLTIGLIGSLYWLDATGRASVPWITFLDLGYGIGAAEYGYQLRFYPIPTLVFLLPFLLMSLMVPETYTSRLARRLAGPATLSTLWLLFVSGRRAIFLSLFLSLVFTVLLMAREARRARIGTEGQKRLAKGLVIAGVSSLAISLFTRFSITNMLSSLRDESAADSERSESASALIASWQESPWFGHGFGATVEGAIRSEERPWNFEVQYHLILNATGVFGGVILGFAALGSFYLAIQAVKNQDTPFDFLLPLIAGAVSLIIANATNPYMHTPGHYWMFFLMIVGANVVHRTIIGNHTRVCVNAPRATGALQHSMPASELGASLSGPSTR